MARKPRNAAQPTKTLALTERLEAARLPDTDTLDLSSLGLTELPAELFALRHVRTLNLAENALTSLPDDIAKLTGLRIVMLSGNPIEAIPSGVFELVELTGLFLDRTLITSIPNDIGKLRNLEHLHASITPMTSISDQIASLERLSDLWLQHTDLRAFPDVIFECRGLNTLVVAGRGPGAKSDISFGAISNKLGNLTRLTYLALMQCGLTSLPDVFDRFPELTHLDLKRNDLTSLPATMRTLVDLEELNLSDNNLPIPPEILSAKPKQILNFYFTLAGGGPKVALNEAKMVVVGQGGVGKTSLVNRLLLRTFDPRESTTRGIRILPWHDGSGDDRLTVNIWDFGGQEIMHATHQFFLTKRTLYVLVLDSRQGEQESRLEYWLKIIQSFGGASPIIIVCNKADEHILSLDENGLRRKYPNIAHIAGRVSCAGEGEGIDGLRTTTLQQLRGLEHLRDQFPTSWIAIKNALEAMKDDYISYDAYQALCRDNGVTDPLSQSTLVAFLHDLGVVLHFADDPRLRDTGILNPLWVTEGVYEILNTHLDGGVLPISRLTEILDPVKYPPDQHVFITDMMKKFELCFEFEAPRDTFLLPDLLPKNEPDTGNWQDSLRFQYHYDVLPSSVISRFIVRMSPFISRGTYWRSGVVIAKDGCRALIKADLEDRKIFIQVSFIRTTGTGGRRTLLDIIRSQFELIHATIPQLAVEEKVPLPDDPAVVADYRNLVTMLELGQTSFVPVGSKRSYEVRPLLDDIETAERREAKKEEDTAPATRRTRPPAPPPVVAEKPVWWHIGLFVMLAFLAIVGAFGGVAWLVGGAGLSVVVGGSVLMLCLVGVLVAWWSGWLTERNAVSLLNKLLTRVKPVGSAKSG